MQILKFLKVPWDFASLHYPVGSRMFKQPSNARFFVAASLASSIGVVVAAALWRRRRRSLGAPPQPSRPEVEVFTAPYDLAEPDAVLWCTTPGLEHVCCDELQRKLAGGGTVAAEDLDCAPGNVRCRLHPTALSAVTRSQLARLRSVERLYACLLSTRLPALLLTEVAGRDGEREARVVPRECTRARYLRANRLFSSSPPLPTQPPTPPPRRSARSMRPSPPSRTVGGLARWRCGSAANPPPFHPQRPVSLRRRRLAAAALRS